MRTHKGLAWHLLCILSKFLGSNSLLLQCLVRDKTVSSRTPSVTETSKLRQMTCCSLWQLRCTKEVLPYAGLRPAYLQGLSTGTGAATQDDSLPFHLTLLRNCEARFHVSLPPCLFFSKSKHSYFFYYESLLPPRMVCSLLNFKTGPLHLNIILKSE